MKVHDLGLNDLGRQVIYRLKTGGGQTTVIGKLLAFVPDLTVEHFPPEALFRKRAHTNFIELHIGNAVVHADWNDDIDILED